MSGPSLLFVHGWGFDASFWNPLRASLGHPAGAAADLGYFGAPSVPRLDGPVLVIAHSLGAMLALADPPAGCVGLVAVNGFDRFGAGPDFPGVPRRVIDRMLARLQTEPREVVAEFRRRCGSDAGFGLPRTEKLAEHLTLLRDGDARGRTAAWGLPLLALEGEDDPLLSPELRARAFSASPQVDRHMCSGGGHALPLTRPDWCAGQVRSLLGSLA